MIRKRPVKIPLPRPVGLDNGRKHGQIVAMTREERRIIFDYAEVYKAIHTLCAQKELRVPPTGNITAMVLKDDDPNTGFFAQPPKNVISELRQVE
jgi:hypothetical protein